MNDGLHVQSDGTGHGTRIWANGAPLRALSLAYRVAAGEVATATVVVPATPFDLDMPLGNVSIIEQLVTWGDEPIYDQLVAEIGAPGSVAA